MGLKENIKTRRLALGLTLEQVARAVGVSKATLQRYESGVISNIPSEKIELLAHALGTTPSALMGWNTDDLDSEFSEYLEQLKNRSEIRMLFKIAKNASKTDIEKAVRIIEALKNVGEEK